MKLQIDSNKIENIINNDYGYKNIILQHNQSIANTRHKTSTQITKDYQTYNKFSHITHQFDIPIILSNMPCVQNDVILKTFDEKRWPYVYHRIHGFDDIYEFVKKINKEKWHLKSISVGVSKNDKLLLEKINNNNLHLDWITVDVALCYNKNFQNYIEWIRETFPDVYLIVGNFSSPEALEWLHNLGVNCGKFGIGVSELCKTRQYTGFGSTTISDLIQCKLHTKKLHYDIDIISDGGLQILDEENGDIAYGDIFKAFNFGATWVMSSSLFRWVKELADENGNIEQYGNSTSRAKKHDKNVEGAIKTFKTNNRTLEYNMKIIKEHLQSSMSYAGIDNIKDAFLSCDWKIVK